MSYLGSWNIDNLLTFYCNTQVFATGVATDADSVPTYRVYEDETGTPILTGSMALIDSANTAGFYSEQITLSAANGFEIGKCYSIYIAATVSSVAGAMHHTFQMGAAVNSVLVAGAAPIDAAAITTACTASLATTTYAEPGQGAPAATASIASKIGYMYKFMRNRLTNDGTTLKVYADDATTVDQKSTVSASGGTVTRGEFASGP